MGKLYDACQQIQEHVQSQGLDEFKTRGAIALEAGFLISLVGENDPDDPDKLAKLESAARKVLGLNISV